MNRKTFLATLLAAPMAIIGLRSKRKRHDSLVWISGLTIKGSDLITVWERKDIETTTIELRGEANELAQKWLKSAKQ